MPYCQAGGDRIYYFDSGTATPRGGWTVVFVHGSGGSHRHWFYQAEFLAGAGHRVLAPDLPGHGRSGGTPPAGVAGFREFLAGFLRTAGADGDRVILAGHSLGGAIVLDFARVYPERLAGMVLVGTGARLRVLPAVLETLRRGERVPEFIRMAYAEGAPRHLVEAGEREWLANEPAVLFADLAACDRFDAMEALSGIEVPALVVCGEGDRLTPPRYSRYLAEHLARATLLVVEGAGHMVMLERPEAVNGGLGTFLDDLAAQAVAGHGRV